MKQKKQTLIKLSIILLCGLILGSCSLDPNNEPGSTTPTPPTELKPNPNPE